MIDLKQLDKLLQRHPGNSLLGLSFDGSRLDGVWVRRTNGSVEIQKTFSASLSLDPLTAEVELAGREIRKQLDAEQIRERWCVVCLPLNWALTLTVKLPELAEEDVADFLQIEAERGFPYSLEELRLAHSRFNAGSTDKFATLVGMPREHVTRLEAVLRAAQLRPVTFSLGLTALQPAAADVAEGTLALLAGETSVAMQVSCGGGVVYLRTLGGAYEQVGAGRELQTEHIARELRITLGQLPHEVREAMKRVRVFGRNEAATELAEELRAAAADWGLKVEHVRDHAATEFGVRIPSGTPISGALGLAVRQLAGQSGMEFLPPKVSPLTQFAERYSSGKLAYAGMGVGALALIVLIAFFVQQIVLWHWQSKWSGMEAQVTELTQMRDQIRRYRPWYDESVRTLAILKRLTEAFPQDGAVSAKTIELREPARVTCSGTARNREVFIRTLDQLRSATNQISDIHIEMTRGNTPLEFTFNFQWGGGGAP
ncbi:MAG: hypothetical protein MUF81_05765 [Verrucomicrobia bacterium]|jgi:hypothetical protein|nr:hypothetical protein [Verrucomicrobiota bacterium]